MHWLRVVILAYLLIVLQTTLFNSRLLAFQIFDVSINPDLMLLLALFIAMVAEPAEVFIAAWSLGLVEDLTVTRGPLGVAAMLFGVLAWLLRQFRELFPFDRILVQLLLALVFVFIVRFPQQLILFWLNDSPAGPVYAFQKALGDAAYSAILAPYLFWLMNKTIRRGNAVRR